MNFVQRWAIMKSLQDRARRRSANAREDPEELLPDSDLSDAERRAALKREARRRRQEENR